MDLFGKMQNSISGAGWSSKMAKPRYMSFSQAIESVTRAKKSDVRGGKFPVHVSSAINFCARAHFIMSESGREYTRPIRVADEMLWAIGKATEKVCKDKLREAYGTHNVYAEWSCVCGKTTLQGLGKNPFGSKCNFCKTSITSVCDELTLNFKGLLQGNPDLLIMDGDPPRLHVIEMKSIKGEDFKNLRGPSADYKMQAYLYLRLLEYNRAMFEEAGVEIDNEEFTILYTSKAYSFRDSVQKEYRIKVSELPSSFVRLADELITEIGRAKVTFDLPPRVLCKSEKDPLASKCAVRGECFGCE